MRYQRSQGKGMNRPRAQSEDGWEGRKAPRTGRGRGRGRGRYSSRYDDPFDDDEDEDSDDLPLSDDSE
jgi:hypothetical protein